MNGVVKVGICSAALYNHRAVFLVGRGVVKAQLANNIHTYMHSVYGMNCLSPKAVYNWVEKFAH